MSKSLDWTKTGTIVAMAEWLREKSGALAVVVIRRDDAALAADLHLAAKDARDLVTDRVAGLARDLQAARTEKRKGARLELGPIEECALKVTRLWVSPELITTMLTTGYVLRGELEISDGVPPNSVLVAIGWDAGRRCYALDFHHQSFEWVNEGQEPPILEVHVTRKNAVLADALSE